MNTPSLQHAKDSFNAFRVESVWLRSIYDTAHALFSSGPEVDALLKRVAPQFFADLNHMFIEYWILGVSRLTDKARSLGRENLTVTLLLQQLESLGLCSDDIQRSAASLVAYRSVLNEARNRVVSHADKQTILNPALLGEHQDAQIQDFLKHLQKFNDLVGNSLGEGPLDFRSTYGPGDVHDLLRVLRSAS